MVRFETLDPEIRGVLGKKVSELGLRVEGSPVEGYVRQLYRELERRGDSAGLFFNSLQAMSGGKIVTAQGGVLVRNQAGQVVGAVGVSGDASDKDEACAIHGIVAAGLKPDTGDPV